MKKNKKALKIKGSINNSSISKVYQKRLVSSNRFVCYKADKKPYNAETKKLADITNNREYKSYDYTFNVLSNNPIFEGIGFVLGKSDEVSYCGLDIDDCIDENGKIAPEAVKIINLLDTYTEISRSGKGIHCIFIAKKPGKICKNNNLDFCKCLELYDNSRYFALTGNIIRNKDIEYRQKQCNIIYDKYFKCKENTNSEDSFTYVKPLVNKSYDIDYLVFILEKDIKFKNLWNRTVNINDESVIDQSFMNKLCYWLDSNPKLMKEWFYRSPYYLRKDKVHKIKANRPDYINRTIENAIIYNRRKKEDE